MKTHSLWHVGPYTNRAQTCTTHMQSYTRMDMRNHTHIQACTTPRYLHPETYWAEMQGLLTQWPLMQWPLMQQTCTCNKWMQNILGHGPCTMKHARRLGHTKRDLGHMISDQAPCAAQIHLLPDKCLGTKSAKPKTKDHQMQT